MSRAALLNAWSLSRRSDAVWRALFADEVSQSTMLRAVARALAHPLNPAEAARALIASGDFEDVSFMLADDAFIAAVTPDSHRALEQEVDLARDTHLREMRSRLAELQARARRVGRELDVEGLLSQSGLRRSSDEAKLAEAEAEARAAEAARISALRDRLVRVADDSPRDAITDHWRASVEQALAMGALEAAEAALERGPSSDVASAVEVPPPPIWPFRGEPIERVVSWFFGEGVIPPGFERYRPAAGDTHAWAFLQAARTLAPDALLAALAGVLDSAVLRLSTDADSVTAYLADLSAPGFHALGQGRWPEGVPVWLSANPMQPAPEIPSGQLLVRFAVARNAPRGERVLQLELDDVLSVLHDVRRRDRLLAHLGRQLPLDLAFDRHMADLSVQWARADVPDLADDARGATLLLGAPGMGKSTLLLEFARRTQGTVVDARHADELPSGRVVLVDGVNQLDEAGVRRLVRDVHWARTTRDPSPIVVVAARPEALEPFERAAGTMFHIYTLPPRSIGALRAQAATMLGWVGIQAREPGSYDRMALLAGGNPTVLFLLCDAVAAALSASPAQARRFSPGDLDDAWRSTEFRTAVRTLLWDPIANHDGIVDTIRVLRDFASPGEPLSLENLEWAVNETCGARTPEWIRSRVRILAAYGLVDDLDDGVRIAFGGPGRLLPEWL